MRRPIHPEAVPGEPRAVRWVVDTGDLTVGEVTSAPGTLGPLMQYGVLTRMFVERGGIWTWLAEGQTWTEHGPRIRDAINAALDLPGWDVAEGSSELLRLIAADVVGNQLASYIASHGGVITVVSATNDTVTLDFGGACEDCPAAGSTLHDRVQTAVEARYPGLREIQRDGGPHGGGFLGLPVPGRGRN